MRLEMFIVRRRWTATLFEHFRTSSERSTLFYSFEWRLYNFEIFRPKKRHELEECANGAKNLSSYHFESVRSAIELIAQLRRWWNLQTSVQILNRPKAAQILIGLSSEEWTSERKSDQSSCAVAEFVNQTRFECVTRTAQIESHTRRTD